MKKNILKILSSIMLVSIVSANLVSCNNNTKTESPATESKQESNRYSRKPQVSMGQSDNNTTQSLYTNGEVISLADGSKIKYSDDGNHEIIEQGDGVILIFKNVSDADLEKLEPNQRELVKRQMKADPKGFSLVY